MKLAIILAILVANLAATIAAPGPLRARALEQSNVQIYSRGPGPKRTDSILKNSDDRAEASTSSQTPSTSRKDVLETEKKNPDGSPEKLHRSVKFAESPLLGGHPGQKEGERKKIRRKKKKGLFSR